MHGLQALQLELVNDDARSVAAYSRARSLYAATFGDAAEEKITDNGLRSIPDLAKLIVVIS